MKDDLPAYALLGAGVLAAGAVLCVLLLGTARLLRALGAAITGGVGSESGWDDNQVQLVRRCDDCGKGWRTDNGTSAGLPRLVLARAVRRTWSRHGRPVPGWARPRGTARCPSCLSRRVRASGEPPRPPVPALSLRAALLGAVAAVTGALLLGAAAAGVVTTAGAA